jgi:hypothetical protein
MAVERKDLAGCGFDHWIAGGNMGGMNGLRRCVAVILNSAAPFREIQGFN